MYLFILSVDNLKFFLGRVVLIETYSYLSPQSYMLMSQIASIQVLKNRMRLYPL